MIGEILAGWHDARRTPNRELGHLAYGDVFYKIGYLAGWVIA